MAEMTEVLPNNVCCCESATAVPACRQFNGALAQWCVDTFSKWHRHYRQSYTSTDWTFAD